MKTISLQRNFTKLAALAICALLSLVAIARADDLGYQEDNQQGGEISGLESFFERVSLTSPLLTAGMGGEARLSVRDKNGTSTGCIELKPIGLPVGTYNVSVTLISDSSSVVLGSFDVSVPALGSTIPTAKVRFGSDSSNPWPVGLNGFDIGDLLITTGSDNATVLSGDFGNADVTGYAWFHANVTTVPGIAAPGSKGHVMIEVQFHKGVQKGVFMLKALKMPGSAMMVLSINGVDVGNVTSDWHGRISITRTPGHHAARKARPGINFLPDSVDILSIYSISLHSADGTELLHADL